LACEVIVEKQLAARAAASLQRRDAEIRKVLAGFGKNMRDAKPVEPHFDGTVQTSQGDPSV